MSDVPALHLVGYSVVDDDCEGFLGLALAISDNSGNAISKVKQIRLWPDKAENYPIKARVRLLMEAWCRFYNTKCGEQEKDYYLLDDIADGFASLPRYTVSSDWKLFETSPSEHVFANNDNTKFLRVVEGDFTEELTQAEYLELRSGISRFEFEEPKVVS